MNFLLSEEQLEMQRSVERFLQERCNSQQLHAAFDGPAEFDEALWKGLCELGVAGMMLPDAAGGMALELIDMAAVAEVVGRAAAPVPLLGHVLGGLALKLGGNASLHERYLPSMASGQCLATVAFCETRGSVDANGFGAAWQPEQWQNELDADGCLSGSYAFVTHAAQANVLVLGLRGGRLALVDSEASGLTITPQDGIDRTRRFSRVKLERTPVTLLEGAFGPRLRDAGLVLLAADAFGGASRCVDMAVDYAKVREQFGQPIGRFQGLKHQIVNMAIEVEPARGHYWFAAHAWDHLPEQSAASAAMAKAHLGERFLQASRDTVEAHGGIGYTWEYDLQIIFKRAMFDHAWLGTPTEHRSRAADMAGW